MAMMVAKNAYEDLVPVPLAALELPLPLPVAVDFVAERLETWPAVTGRLEYVNGRLLYMPPSGDLQQDTCADVVALLVAWRKQHPGFVVGGNEAGMRLGADIRAADAAVWRRADLGDYEGGLREVPPVLAVEVAGKYDTEELLRQKAGWYLGHGVEVVWLVLPDVREAVVLTSGGEHRCALADALPQHPGLPGLAPRVAELFEQVTGQPASS